MRACNVHSSNNSGVCTCEIIQRMFFVRMYGTYVSKIRLHVHNIAAPTASCMVTRRMLR